MKILDVTVDRHEHDDGKPSWRVLVDEYPEFEGLHWRQRDLGDGFMYLVENEDGWAQFMFDTPRDRSGAMGGTVLLDSLGCDVTLYIRGAWTSRASIVNGMDLASGPLVDVIVYTAGSHGRNASVLASFMFDALERVTTEYEPLVMAEAEVFPGEWTFIPFYDNGDCVKCDATGRRDPYRDRKVGIADPDIPCRACEGTGSVYTT